MAVRLVRVAWLCGALVLALAANPKPQGKGELVKRKQLAWQSRGARPTALSAARAISAKFLRLDRPEMCPERCNKRGRCLIDLTDSDGGSVHVPEYK
jgi:hypothetical protein